MTRNRRFDVIVIGGGPSGFGAALGAAKRGVSVALVERHPVLGGMGTSALVNNFVSAHHDGERFLIGGFFAIIRDRLIQRKALYANADAETARNGCMEIFEPNIYAEELLRLCVENNVEVFLGRKIESLKWNTSKTDIFLDGGEQIEARQVVDCTGDAMAASAAGVPCNFGRPKDGAVMPLTYCYMIGPVNLEETFSRNPEYRHIDPHSGECYLWFGGLHDEIKDARARGLLTIERDHVAIVTSMPGRPDYVTVNFGRVFVKNPTDPDQLKEAEIVGKSQVDEGIRFFRRYVPGFENVQLIELARQIGVRETRQIRGLYTLNADDILSCRQFEDVIAQSHAPIDIHQPNSDRTRYTPLPVGQHYDIPLRCLIPATGPGNLIVGGRCISATHEAMSSFRVSPSAMAIGQAAGTTAGIAITTGYDIGQIDFQSVQKALERDSAILR